MRREHTKGPWRYVRWYGAENSEDEKAQAECNCETIEELRMNNPIVGIVGANGESIIVAHDCATIDGKDASLIAAAPELLAALEQCQWFLSTSAFYNHEIRPQVESAIKKAKGE